MSILQLQQKKNLSIPIILIDEKELYNDQKTYS